MKTISDYRNEFIAYMRLERQLSETTIKNYLTDLRILDDFLNHKAVFQIELTDIRAFVRGLKSNGMATSTIKRKIHAAITFWRWLYIIGDVNEVMPEKMLRLLPPQTRKTVENWLSVDELKTFVNTPADSVRDFLAFNLLAWLGLRRAELLSIRIEDIHFPDRVIVIHGKGGHKRILGFPEELITYMEAVIMGRQSGWLFAEPNGNKWDYRMFHKAFVSHLIRCGLQDRGITPHVLRHTFGTHLIADGVPMATVSRLMGHKDIKTTMIYAHHDPAHLIEAMKKHPLVKDKTNG